MHRATWSRRPGASRSNSVMSKENARHRWSSQTPVAGTSGDRPTPLPAGTRLFGQKSRRLIQRWIWLRFRCQRKTDRAFPVILGETRRLTFWTLNEARALVISARDCQQPQDGIFAAFLADTHSTRCRLNHHRPIQPLTGFRARLPCPGCSRMVTAHRDTIGCALAITPAAHLTPPSARFLGHTLEHIQQLEQPARNGFLSHYVFFHFVFPPFITN